MSICHAVEMRWAFNTSYSNTLADAAVNFVQLLSAPNSVYLKAAKTTRVGCAIWDLAALPLMLTELGGTAS